jgi:hypothetical protein
MDLRYGWRGAPGGAETRVQRVCWTRALRERETCPQHDGRMPMKPSAAFDVCHEVYAAAREIVNSRMPTLQLDRASKFLWRPDLRPRLVEYVADFALAGARALGDDQPRAVYGMPDKLSREIAARWKPRRGSKELRASRLVLFRLYYVGGAEYQAARRLLGLSETSWSVWSEEIRARVGRELLRAGLFPPSRYFREMSSPRRGPRGGNREASCEQAHNSAESGETVAMALDSPLG